MKTLISVCTGLVLLTAQITLAAPKHPHNHHASFSEEQAEKKLEKMREHLDLSDEQVADIEAVFAENREEIKAAHQDFKESRRNLRKAMKNQRKAVKAILTEEQREKMKSHMRKRIHDRVEKELDNDQ